MRVSAGSGLYDDLSIMNRQKSKGFLGLFFAAIHKRRREVFPDNTGHLDILKPLFQHFPEFQACREKKAVNISKSEEYAAFSKRAVDSFKEFPLLSLRECRPRKAGNDAVAAVFLMFGQISFDLLPRCLIDSCSRAVFSGVTGKLGVNLQTKENTLWGYFPQ